MRTLLGQRRCRALSTTLLALWAITSTTTAAAQDVIDVGSRLEPFVDDYLIDTLDGTRHEFHEPVPAGTALAFDSPWDGLFSAYITIFQDGDTYRMYYRGLPGLSASQVTCYAESSDGINWTKPNLGLFEIGGTSDNNVILTPATAGPATHNFCAFIDGKPGVPPSERYKGVGGDSGGLLGFASPDGIHWSRVRDAPIITGGAFDSLNVAFWSATENSYVSYYRVFGGGYRQINRVTSTDFLNWTGAVRMEYGNTPIEHLYTNATHPYFRAPHIYIALPARFLPGRRVLTDDQATALGITDLSSFLLRDVSEGCFMTTRGDNQYHRAFLEGYTRPGLGYENWVSRTNYPAFGVVPTGPHEMSVYVRRDYGQTTAHLERLTLRLDGFASINAPYDGGEFVTKPFTFTGQELAVNYSTSAAGSLWVEIQDQTGTPIPGYTQNDADEIIGDEIERIVSWGGRTRVASLSGRPVRLRFVMKDADLYAFQFTYTTQGADDCADATPVTAGTGAGSTIDASNDGSASCGRSDDSPDVWYTYTAPAPGDLVLDTCGSSIDTVLSAYTGTCDDLIPAACADDGDCAEGCNETDSCLSLPVVKDTTYLIRVAGNDGAAGAFNLRVTPELRPLNDDCLEADQISLGMVAGTTQNATDQGHVAGCGNADLSGDVWYQWTAVGSGTLTLDTCAYAELDTVVSVYTGDCDVGLQEIRCNDDCPGTWCSGPSSCLSVEVDEGETYLIRVAGNEGAEGPFWLTLSADVTMSPLPQAIVFTRNRDVVWQDDGFEDDTSGDGPNPAALGAHSAAGAVTVLGPDDPGPGAHLGDNYLRWLRGSGGSRPNFTALLPGVPEGQLFTAAFAMSYEAGCPNFFLEAPGGTNWPDSYIQLMYFFGPEAGETKGDITYYNPTGGHIPTGLTHTPGEWHAVRIDWIVGGPNMLLTVDGESVTVPVWHPDQDVAAFAFDTGCGDTVAYLDAVSVVLRIRPDLDEDGDVDQSDFGYLQACYSISLLVPVEPDCQAADLDRNGRVDDEDFSLFQSCVSGPGVPPLPGCGR